MKKILLATFLILATTASHAEQTVKFPDRQSAVAHLDTVNYSSGECLWEVKMFRELGLGYPGCVQLADSSKKGSLEEAAKSLHKYNAMTKIRLKRLHEVNANVNEIRKLLRQYKEESK